MKILLVDDHAVVRAGLKQLLIAALGADVQEAATGAEALILVEQSCPDLILLDLGLPGPGGLALLPKFHRQGLRVLVLSMHAEAVYAQRALEAGAAGYISKNITPEDLLDAVRKVLKGQHYIEQAIAQELAFQKSAAGTSFHRLTLRDLDIVRLLAEGRSMSEIAVALGVSYKTIANTASAIRTKLGVSRTADLIRVAADMQIKPDIPMVR